MQDFDDPTAQPWMTPPDEEKTIDPEVVARAASVVEVLQTEGGKNIKAYLEQALATAEQSTIEHCMIDGRVIPELAGQHVGIKHALVSALMFFEECQKVVDKAARQKQKQT